MAEKGFPLPGASLTTVDDWRLFFSKIMTPGVWAGYLNALAVTANGLSMNVTVDSGAATVIGFYYQSDAARSLTIAAAHATLPRIDTVVVRLDLVTPSFTTAVKTGVPNSSPVSPAFTETATVYEIALADVRVDAAVGTIAAGKVTDRRAFATPAVSALGISQAMLALASVDEAQLAVSGVTAGTYGGASTAPALTITAKGRISAASNTPISVSTANYLAGSVTADKLEAHVPGRSLPKMWGFVATP